MDATELPYITGLHLGTRGIGPYLTEYFITRLPEPPHKQWSHVKTATRDTPKTTKRFTSPKHTEMSSFPPTSMSQVICSFALDMCKDHSQRKACLKNKGKHCKLWEKNRIKRDENGKKKIEFGRKTEFWPYLPQSADLSPIERLWDVVEREVGIMGAQLTNLSVWT